MRLASLFVLGVAIALPASAQISFTDTYYQDFDGIGTDAAASLPDGWRVATWPADVEPGSFDAAVSVTDFRGGNSFPYLSLGGIVNFGAGPAETATDRAVGFSLRAGETETAILYAFFRNDTGAALDNLFYSVTREVYRGGGSGTVLVDAFWSLDSSTWTRFQRSQTSSINTESDGFPDAPQGSLDRQANQPVQVPAGADFYLAFRYRIESVDAPTAPALGFDEFALSRDEGSVSVVWPHRGEFDLGEVPVGDTRIGYIYATVVSPPPVVLVGTFTGPHADDFEIEPGFAPFWESVIRFEPSAPGVREATLQFAAADTTSRTVALSGTGTSLTSSDDQAPSTRLLIETWPNPTTGPVTMRLHIAEASPARLSVHDALGREVAAVLDRRLTEGTHDVSFDPAGLVPGVYFTRLTTQGESVTSALTISR